MASTNGTPENGVDAAALYPDALAAGDRSSPVDHLRTLWQGKWLILGLVVLAGGMAYLYYQSQPRQYRASSALLLDESERSERLADFLPTKPSNRIGRALYFLRTSQVFARRVADTLRTRDVALRPGTGASLLWTATGAPRSAAALASRLQGAVSVRRDAQDVPAVRIEVTSSHPKEAALVANTYAEVYGERLRRTSSARMRTTRQFLQRQKAELQDRLRALEDSIAARVRASGQLGLLSPADSGRGIVGEANQLAQKISDLTVQKEQVQLDLEMERALLDSAKARLRRIRPNLAARAASTTPDHLRETHQNIASLQADIRAIEARNDSLAPNMQAKVGEMRARVDTLQARADRLAQEYVDQSLSTDAINPLGGGEGGSLSPVVDLKQKITQRQVAITRLSAKLDVLNERLGDRRAALRASPDRTLARLRRRKSTTKELFVSLTQSLQRAQVSEESTPEQASIIQRAAPPSTPIAPEVWSKVLLATLMGGVGGCGFVLLYNRFDDIVEAPDDLEQSPNALFGTIPEWEAEMEPTAGGDEADWPGVVAPFSPAAEAYRHVATNVRLGVPHAVSALLVTSPGARDGKTTTVANLGVALSEAGRDVLLVDADLQSPSLHQMFGVDRTPGLTDRLSETREGVRLLRTQQGGDDRRTLPHGPNGDASEGPFSETQRQQAGRLGLLAAGADVPRPALLLQEDHIRPLLETLTASWDVVLFDTPPALLYDDAFRLASLTDLVLLLAAAGETRRGAFRDVRTRLDTVSPHGVAALLNRYRAGGGAAYGYDSYSYASYRKDEPQPKPFVERMSRGFRRIVKG
jgi:succinoglycan biosynthesis transport protein ExoP